MKGFGLSMLLAAALVVAGLEQTAWAGRRKTPSPTWHGNYYEATWGMPLALVVPPKAEKQTHYGWGVGRTRTTPIYYQYEPGYAMPGFFNRAWFQPVPNWPSDTDQLGVYYIRGPW